MRPLAEILTIGNEILKGSTLNTNARYLGKELTSDGFEVIRQSACRDDLVEIKNALSGAFGRADLVIACGGLGPTPDDLTRDAVAAYFGVPLQISKKQMDFIQNYYRARGRKMPKIVQKEAMFPENSKPLFNHFGIALGFYVIEKRKMLVVLPGVPIELEKMYIKLVKPLYKKYFPVISKRYCLVAKTVGLGEPTVMEKLGKDFFRDAFDFGIYPHPGEVGIRIYTESKTIVDRLQRKLKIRLSKNLYALEDISLVEALKRIFSKRGNTLAVAESCTGGLLSSEITKFSGASSFFRGSVTAYQSDIKAGLGVNPKLIRRFGVISEQVAQALALAARRSLRADYGIGITGVAGPEKEESKPVGLVYLAIANGNKVWVWKENFFGDREQIQRKAVIKALEYLWRLVR